MKNIIRLKLSSALTLPLETVTQTIAILAKRRAGKSYLMRRLVEQLYHAKQQIVLVDPKGDQWGVRSTADGKGSGLSIVILGGEHGDVPLEPNSGEIVAKLIVEDRVSALLDLSLFRKHEVATFMAAFLENLYRLKAREIYRTPIMLVIDEADEIAPQKPQHGEERMLGAAEDIVRRGGQRGIGCVLVTQRSAVLNKNVLTQTQILVALRTIAPQDLAAMNAWIDVHGTPEQRKTLMESLPSLPVGDAWFWSPGWPTVDGIFKRVHVLPIETFDSGATPKPGEVRREPKTVADVDLEALKRQMAATIERVKSDNPAALRKRIAELERHKCPVVNQNPVKIKHIEVPIVGKRALEGLKKSEASMRRILAAIKDANARTAEHIVIVEKNIAKFAADMVKVDQKNAEAVSRVREVSIGRVTAGPVREGQHVAVPPPKSRFESVLPLNNGETAPEKKMGIGERIILIAVAQRQDGISREHLTVLTGYKRSSRDAYIQRLRVRGLINLAGDRLVITREGVEELGNDYEILPTGEELRIKLMNTLPEGEKRILSILIDTYPESVERETLSNVTNYQRSSRDTYLQRLRARQLVEFIGRGVVKASEKLFE